MTPLIQPLLESSNYTKTLPSIPFSTNGRGEEERELLNGIPEQSLPEGGVVVIPVVKQDGELLPVKQEDPP